MSHHTFITYSELFGQRASEEQLGKLIKTFNKRATFAHLAMINNLLALFPISFNQEISVHIQRLLCANLFDRHLFERLRTFVESTSLIDRPIFQRQQILLLMKRVLMEGLDKGGLDPDVNRESRNKIGEALFILSDLLVTEEQESRTHSDNPLDESESDRVLSELLVQMLPVMELMNPPEITKALVRTRTYIRLSLQHYSEVLGGKSLSQFFEEAEGISFERFFQMVVGIYSTAISHSIHALLQNPANFNIRRSAHFANLDFGATEIENFFRLTTLSLTGLEEQLAQAPATLLPQYDFNTFRRYPLFTLSNDIITASDYTFLTEKVSTGLYYTILNSLNTAQINPDPFFRTWGYIFEIYVNDIFRSLFPEESQQFYPNTFFDIKGEAEAFDGLILYPDSLVLMEYKGGLLNSKAKYSGDVEILLREMGSKFGVGSNKAAINQLCRNIEFLFNENATVRRKIKGLDIQKVEKVYPVLIANDTSLEFPLAHWRLRTWFDREIKSKILDAALSVKPLLILTVEDVEMIVPYLQAGDFTLLELLQFYAPLEYVRFPPEGHWYEPMTSFREVFHRFRKGRNIAFRRNEEMDSEWEQFMNNILSSFKSGIV